MLAGLSLSEWQISLSRVPIAFSRIHILDVDKNHIGISQNNVRMHLHICQYNVTHISPLVKMFGCVPLELCVSFVSCYRGSSSGQPSLSDVHMVTFHPLWPVTTVTAMHKTSTLQEKRGSCHHGCFLVKTFSKINKTIFGSLYSLKIKTNFWPWFKDAV